MAHAQQCPWCDRWALNGGACSFIYACGLDAEGTFHVGAGCGRSWCWECGKKYCGWYLNPADGHRVEIRRETHGNCCQYEPGFTPDAYCAGGHSVQCAARTFTVEMEQEAQ